MLKIISQIENGILSDCCTLELVFSNKAEAAGLVSAKEKGYKTGYITSKGLKRETFDQKVVDYLTKYELDYIILAGYMRILSPIMVKAYKQKIINIHPADTALFKGIGAYEWAFKNQLEETTISVHYVDEGVDTGPIIAQKKVKLKGANTLEEVEQRGLQVEHQFYSEALAHVFKN